jgi:hypothetical protein
MRYLSIVCLLVASSALWQQERTPASANLQEKPQAATPVGEEDEEPPLPESASKVAPDAAVITIRGLCTPPSPSSSENPRLECPTQISRAQFEKLVDAVLINKRASSQRELARGYPGLLAMAQAAEKLGIENSPRFQQRMAYARLQMLSHELVHQIEQDSAKISQKEVEDYYRNHSAEFKSATLERIYIPNRKRIVASADGKALSEAQRNSEAEMNQVAEKLRQRAAAGENFLLLQKEAYMAAGMTDVPPNPSLGQVSENGLPHGHAFALDLKVGEVSQVFSDPSGHYIYRLDSKRPEPSQETYAEILRLLKLQRRDKALKAIQQPVTSELNPAYFGPASKHSSDDDPK